MNYYIIYPHGDNTESYNVFYSTVVMAESKDKAIQKFCDNMNEYYKINYPGNYLDPRVIGEDLDCEYGIDQIQILS